MERPDGVYIDNSDGMLAVIRDMSGLWVRTLNEEYHSLWHFEEEKDSRISFLLPIQLIEK